ncbi:hypothetical protein [Cerasicoccus fimbriatus]|uniref:hypothetical protein n=1 Tax=Cerasicoccus fimbriatus TaxID=3014554 RepID=UPI0022B32EF2|nr:hypothetical protein [Cerasicoccus sp. TK19100]
MMSYTYTKMKNAGVCAAALLLGAGFAQAQINEELTGDAATSVTPPTESSVGGAISGSLNFDFNSHFISYGADVWGEGGSWNNLLFNPSLSLTMDFGDGFYGFVGTWWDVNSIGTSGIGDDIQEIDLWIGFGYTYEKWNFELTYQEWIYAQDAERILDVVVSYDTFLNPTLVIHNRVDGNGTQDTGTVFVLGVSEGFTYEELSVDFGVDVAFNTDNYYGGQGGFTYLALGPQLSYPLNFIGEQYGAWNIHGGMTFYYTPNNTIPTNITETFLTGNVGIGVDF